MDELKLIDGDIHCTEPRMVFTEYLDRAYRDRVQIVDVIDDPQFQPNIYDVMLDGLPIPVFRGDRKARYQAIHEGFKRKYSPGSAWEPGQYLRDLDHERIDQVVIYPSVFLFAAYVPQLGAKFSTALCRAYNDWMHDFCAADRRRLKAAACLPLHDPADAIAEAKRCADLGFIAAFVRPNPLYGRTLAHPDYIPLFEVLEDLQMTLGIHEGGMSYVPILGEDRVKQPWAMHALSHAFEMMCAVVTLLEAGTIDRFRKLNFLFLEAGSCLWVPYWLGRLDEELELTYRVKGNLSAKPSEIFKRQCYTTTECNDPFMAKAVESFGDATRFLLTTDYPHLETSYPHSRERFFEKALSDADRVSIARENSLRAYPRLR